MNQALPHINAPVNTYEPDLKDYQMVRDVIEIISLDWQTQPQLESLAKRLGVGPTQLQKTFKRWAGLSPKGFLEAVTFDHAKRLLDQNLPLLEASHALGLSGPSRLHDLFVSHTAMSPGIYKSKGQGLHISWGFHASPFGNALLMVTEQGLVGVAFCDEGEEETALNDMMMRWPNANYLEDSAKTQPYLHRCFNTERWAEAEPLRVVLIGTDFEIRVWETLLSIPLGQATTYSSIAHELGNPKASRAVGRAVGRNPISFVVPCHRVVGKNGALTGYHWGLTRKKAMLGWEAGKVSEGSGIWRSHRISHQ